MTGLETSKITYY